MTHRPLRPPLAAAAALTAGVLALAGCGATGASSAKQSSPSASSAAGGPISVQSCGETITLPEPPKRVIFVNSVGTSVLQDLGLLDRVIARAGNLDTGVFEGPGRETLEKIPTLASKDTGSGHLSVPTESILEKKPDLVIGFTSAVDGPKLKQANIPLYIPASYCPTRPAGKITFDAVFSEVRTFGTLFGVSDKAEQVNAALRGRIDAVTSSHRGGAARSAVALYVTPGDTKVSAYGHQGMAQALFDATGLTNVYADKDGRAFDVSNEDLLAKNPDVVLVLHSTGSASEVMKSFTGNGGLGTLKAVKSKNVIVLPYPLSDPPSPLSVKGAEQLSRAVAAKKS